MVMGLPLKRPLSQNCALPFVWFDCGVFLPANLFLGTWSLLLFEDRVLLVSGRIDRPRRPAMLAMSCRRHSPGIGGNSKLQNKYPQHTILGGRSNMQNVLQNSDASAGARAEVCCKI